MISEIMNVQTINKSIIFVESSVIDNTDHAQITQALIEDIEDIPLVGTTQKQIAFISTKVEN